MKFSEVYSNMENKVCQKYITAMGVGRDKLTSLEGSPKLAKKDFNVSHNKLTSLKYSPDIIEGNFNVSHNELTSLEGRPSVVKQNFNRSDNNLKTLKGRPFEIGGSFSIHHNPELSSLEYSPKIIKKAFNCNNNPKLKNVKKQIIKYGIKALTYWTDEGNFLFDEIKEEFNNYQNLLKEKNKKIQEKEIIQKNKRKISNDDYGYGLF